MPLLSALFVSAACALQPQPLRAAPRPVMAGGALSRRAALLALPFALSASPAFAVCSCPNGFASCVCTEDDGEKQASTVTIQKKRADAAGREAVESRAEILYYREDALSSDEAATTKARNNAKAKGGAPSGPTISAGASDPRSMRVEVGSLSGFGSQNFDDIDKDSAKARFREILLKTVKQREAEYGFELDADDIKQIEGVLRNKYCGKEGLIGPC